MPTQPQIKNQQALKSAFIRSPFTWLAYFMLAYFAYVQASFSPIMPHLRAEMDMSYTLGGLHVSLFAVGMIIAGLTGDRVATRIGRHNLFWLSGAGMALGSTLFIVAQNPAMTLTASFIMSMPGSYLLVMVQAGLSDHHGNQRAIALTESNISASAAVALMPFFVGIGIVIGVGWRLVLIVPIFAWLIARLIAYSVDVPDSQRITTPQQKQNTVTERLPLAFYSYIIMIFLSVSLEWCTITWGADFLEKIVGIHRDLASTLMSFYFIAMIIGRVIGSRFTHRFDSRQLLPIAFGMVALGFPMFWLGQVEWVNLLGLFLMGLGVANAFPLSMASAMAMGQSRLNRASSRVSMSAGLAILISPQILATIADQVGIFNAYAVVGVLLVLVFGNLILARNLEKRLIPT